MFTQFKARSRTLFIQRHFSFLSVFAIAIIATLCLTFSSADNAEAAIGSAEKQILKNLTKELNSYKTLQGEFLQTGPNGRSVGGVFYMKRPGKLRFQYAKPAAIDIVSDGSNVAVRNLRLKTQDLFPLSQTPLRLFLKRKISLDKNKNVTSVSQEGDLLVVTVDDKTAFNDSRLKIFFNPDLTLAQWIVTDAQGLDTTVKVFNMTKNVKVDLTRFVINYNRN